MQIFLFLFLNKIGLFSITTTKNQKEKSEEEKNVIHHIVSLHNCNFAQIQNVESGFRFNTGMPCKHFSMNASAQSHCPN